MPRRTPTPRTPAPKPRTSAQQTNDAALALRRAGRHDEAADLLRARLSLSPRLVGDDYLRLRVTLCVIERERGRVSEALKLHLKDARRADRCEDFCLRGKYHMGLARTYRIIGDAESHERAFIEYAAASYFYERAGERRLYADVENNLAFLVAQTGHFSEAREHLRRAIAACPDDARLRAIVADTSAQIARLEGDLRSALRDAASSLLYALDASAGDDPREVAVETLGEAIDAWRRAQREARLRDVLLSCDWRLREAATRLGYLSRQALANHLRRHFPQLDAERRAKGNSRVALSRTAKGVY
jgi:tetratricopeptide (TPR) repeat protein